MFLSFALLAIMVLVLVIFLVQLHQNSTQKHVVLLLNNSTQVLHDSCI